MSREKLHFCSGELIHRWGKEPARGSMPLRPPRRWMAVEAAFLGEGIVGERPLHLGAFGDGMRQVRALQVGLAEVGVRQVRAL